MLRNIASLSGLIAVGIAAVFAAPPAHAADASASGARSAYLQERAACDAGRTDEARATCLREAGAAEAARRNGDLKNYGSLQQNAIERCNPLPPADKADCLARIDGSNAPNQVTTTSGSVAGGGILSETVTTTTGPPTVLYVPSAPPTSAPR